MVHEIIEHCMVGLGSPDVVHVCGTIAAFELSLRALKYIYIEHLVRYMCTCVSRVEELKL